MQYSARGNPSDEQAGDYGKQNNRKKNRGEIGKKTGNEDRQKNGVKTRREKSTGKKSER